MNMMKNEKKKRWKKLDEQWNELDEQYNELDEQWNEQWKKNLNNRMNLIKIRNSSLKFNFESTRHSGK